MFKKFNTKTLLAAIVVLAAIVLFNIFYQNKKEEDTFREEFVKIDTAAVSTIFIYPKADKGKEIKIIRNGNHWDLQNDKIKTIADSNAVRSLLSNFSEMKSISLAGQDKLSWNDLQVTDSAGTKIIITTNDNHSYPMVIGKFGYGNSNGLTYIRHSDEEEVYAVPGFLSFSVNQPFNSWRNKTFVHGIKDNWTSVTFNYPGDSSFVLNKVNNKWTVNGIEADSAKAVQYLNELANTQSSGFVDGYTPASTPVFSISIAGNNLSSPITIQAYPSDTIQKYIYHSSQNPEAYFSEKESNLFKKIFAGKDYFIK